MKKKIHAHDIWMPLYVNDYLGNTQHLSTEQHGAYLLLILHAWRSGGRIENDDDTFQSITKMSKTDWLKSKQKISKFFLVGSEFWQHDRVVFELNKSKEITNLRSEAGRVGAKNRWEINRVLKQ